MQRAFRRGSAGKAVVGALVAGALVIVVLWGLLSPAPGLAPIRETDLRIKAIETLDAFHEAAARADESAYFAHFAPEGIFLGTDASERWTVDQFRAYAAPHFGKGQGWTYLPMPSDRHIELLQGGTIAVFDELLIHATYGVCRGSGVLRYAGEDWLIVQYNLHFPVPNELAAKITAEIRDFTEPASDPEGMDEADDTARDEAHEETAPE